MMIVDDYSRLGWPYFLKCKPDVPATFAGFLAEIYVKGVASIVECVRGQRHRVRHEGVCGDARPPWHPPRVHARSFPNSQRRGRAADCPGA
ncbi:unnamed protein product [Laminaria digitata]